MELKYKVWDMEQKKMLKVMWESEEDRYNKGQAILRYSTMTGIYPTLSGYRDEDGNPYEIDGEILPYTGVKDINKKESYLGDVLKEPNNNKDFVIITKEENSNNMYLQHHYFVQGQHLRDVLPFNKIKEMHIVGNIYENPDMIKKENE